MAQPGVFPGDATQLPDQAKGQEFAVRAGGGLGAARPGAVGASIALLHPVIHEAEDHQEEVFTAEAVG